MKKALILTVGTGRGVENGISFSLQKSNPNLICFICSDKSMSTVENVLKLTGKTEEDVIIKNIDEVNDIENLFDRYLNIINEVKNTGYKNTEITIDFTSGTKAMSSALVAAAIFSQINDISYVYGERGEGGRVISGTERLNVLSPIAIYTKENIKLFKRFFNKYQFENALALFDKGTIHFKEKNDINLLKNLALAYNLWDKFQFKEAVDIFKSIEKEFTENKFLTEKTLKGNIKILRNLASEESPFDRRGKFLIDELLANAKRRFSEGKFDDGVARLYRLVELVGQVEIFKEFKVSTSEFPLSKIPAPVREKFSEKAVEGKCKIGQNDTFAILSVAGNKLGRTWDENKIKIKKIMQIRNNSILAHGLAPVTKEQYLKFEKLAILFISEENVVEFPKFNL